MTLPHPKSRNGNYRKGDIPNDWGVIWKLFKRTINIPDYRNGEDEVNPAINRTFGGFLHDWFVNLSSGTVNPGINLGIQSTLSEC